MKRATPSVEYQVGLVGLGEISGYFIHGVELNPKTELVAVCRRGALPGDTEKYANYNFYTDWKKLVDDPKVNTIIIATPPSSHSDITEYALKKKKKVIVEKPYSLKLEDGYSAVKLANEEKVHLYFAYHAAFNPLALKSKEKISELKKSGEVISSFKVIFKEDVRNYHGNNSWIFEPSISGGGCLIDSGVNAISVVENIGVGHLVPSKVTLGKNEKIPKVEVSATVEFVSEKDENVTGVLIQDWLHEGEEQREISVTFKSGKEIKFDYALGTISIKNEKGEVDTQKVKLREDADIHGTPMAYEYINIVNDAVEFFGTNVFVDELGLGPFETIMKTYEMAG